MSTIPTTSASFDTAMFIAKSNNLTRQISLDNASIKKINKTAKEFESVFLSEMMSHIYNDIEVNEMFGGGFGEEMFRSMVVREYGKQMADKGGIGLAKHISAQMIKLQELKTAGGI